MENGDDCEVVSIEQVTAINTACSDQWERPGQYPTSAQLNNFGFNLKQMEAGEEEKIQHHFSSLPPRLPYSNVRQSAELSTESRIASLRTENSIIV